MFSQHHINTLVQAILRGGSSCCPQTRGLRRKRTSHRYIHRQSCRTQCKNFKPTTSEGYIVSLIAKLKAQFPEPLRKLPQLICFSWVSEKTQLMEKLWSAGLESRQAEDCIAQIWGGGAVCAQSREMRWRRQHSHQAVNVVSEALETTLGRNTTLGHEKVNLAQFRRHVTNIIIYIL